MGFNPGLKFFLSNYRLIGQSILSQIGKGQSMNEQKVVLITGASSGIGKAVALQLIKDGYIVYGAARRMEKMTDIKDAGGHILKMDVTDETSLVEGVQKITSENHGVDILINNAGYGSYGAVEDVPIEEAKRQFEVNIFGLAQLTKMVLPHMRKNESGKIINISSIGGKIYTPLGGWYHATKHALEGLSDCLRLETKQFGIDVVVIEPGSIETEWTQIAIDNMLKTSDEGAYGNFAQKVVKAFRAGAKRSSPPKVIVNLILKAIKAKNPKTRYVAGAYATPLLLMRKILPDKMFDWMLLSQLK